MKPAGGRGLAMARLNESCSGCHREQTKLHVFEHEALREGCTDVSCPHGSVNPKLLVERDYNLCLKCHAQTRGNAVALHRQRTPRRLPFCAGPAGRPVAHPAVHGSSVSPHLHY